MFDIVIVGGGMVGASLASSLRDSNLSVALIEPRPPQSFKDPRLIALNYSSCCLYQNIGIWEELSPFRSEIQEVHVSHRGHFGATRIKAFDVNLPFLGSVIPALNINQVLYNKMGKTSFFCPAKVSSLNILKDHTEVVLEVEGESKTILGKVIIGADGTDSTVRQLLNFKVKQYDYQQKALVTITELNHSHHSIAYERFLDEGAIAMLPLVGNRVATIWSAGAKLIDDLQRLTEEEFLGLLQKQFGFRLGKLKRVHQRFVFPLHAIWVENSIQDNVILIGNAAHTLHPIAAQGLNLALYEVAYLAEQFLDKKNRLLTMLKTKQHQLSYTLSHYLSLFFSSDLSLVSPFRQMGLLLLNYVPPLKKNFGLHAMGRVGHIPFLMREV